MHEEHLEAPSNCKGLYCFSIKLNNSANQLVSMSLPKENVITILKEKYEYENERKRYFDNVITLPISLLGFLVAGIYFLVIDKTQFLFFNSAKSWLIYGLLAGTVLSVFFLFRVFFGLKRTYCSFPGTNEVLDDFRKISEFRQGHPKKQMNELIEEDFNEFIIAWYKDINENNIKVNDTRMNNFHCAKIFICISYLLGILVFILFCITKLESTSVALKKSPDSVRLY